jgi:phasin
VSDANLKVDGNANSSNANSSKVNGSAKAGFDVPLFAFSGMFRGFAEQGAERARENCEKMKVASGEIAEVLREACSTNAKGAAEYGAKVIEISNENTRSALEFVADLMTTKSLSEAVNVSATQGRKNIEVASAQNRQLWELAQKVATETTEPIKKSFAKVLQSAS